MSHFGGILPALVTPVNDEEEFQCRPYEQLLERVYSAGVQGVYVCGQTGEGFQLSRADRQTATECAVRNSPAGGQVIVHVGAPTTSEAVHLARHAGRSGAQVVSSLPPAGSYSFEEIRRYYEAIAAASDLPLLIYYFPSMAPAIRTTAEVLELCAIPNVIGLKYTASDFFQMAAIRQAGPVVYAGSDEMLVAGLIMGASGGIGSTYNLMAPHFVALYRATSEGRWADAQALQRKINDVIAALLRYPVHAAIKLVLSWTGIDCGSCIPPRRELTGDEQQQLRKALLATELGAQLLSGSVTTA